MSFSGNKLDGLLGFVLVSSCFFIFVRIANRDALNWGKQRLVFRRGLRSREDLDVVTASRLVELHSCRLMLKEVDFQKSEAVQSLLGLQARQRIRIFFVCLTGKLLGCLRRVEIDVALLKELSSQSLRQSSVAFGDSKAACVRHVVIHVRKTFFVGARRVE